MEEMQSHDDNIRCEWNIITDELKRNFSRIIRTIPFTYITSAGKN
jgi:hypothetical protein